LLLRLGWKGKTAVKTAAEQDEVEASRAAQDLRLARISAWIPLACVLACVALAWIALAWIALAWISALADRPGRQDRQYRRFTQDPFELGTDSGIQSARGGAEQGTARAPWLER
jgi:hypothetical protein